MKIVLIFAFTCCGGMLFSQNINSGKIYPNASQKNLRNFKISTNLISPLLEFNGYPGSDGWAIRYRFISSSRDISVEPEYHISDRFSIATPVYFGITRMDLDEDSPTLYTDWNFVDSVSIPQLRYIQTNYDRRLDLIAQIGLQGKWFPWKYKIKEHTHVNPFVSVSTIFGLYDIYSFDFEKTWTSESIIETGEHDYSGGENIPFLAVKSHKTGVFRSEVLLGIELMFGKHIGLTYSLGFSSKRYYFKEATDRVYSRLAGQEYSLTKEFGFPGDDALNVESRMTINRLHLTYSFGGK